MQLTAEQVPALLEEMERAIREFTADLERDPARWDQRQAGKWSPGQHGDHVARMLALSAERLEESADKLRGGALGKRPWRDPLQAYFMGLVTREPFPKGGRSPKHGRPVDTPERGPTLRRIAEGAARHRDFALGLTPEERERIWFWNPFIRLPWHYT